MNTFDNESSDEVLSEQYNNSFDAKNIILIATFVIAAILVAIS